MSEEDAETLEEHVECGRERSRQRSDVVAVELDEYDCIIGATAILEDEPVLTGNVEHFRRNPNLEVETYGS